MPESICTGGARRAAGQDAGGVARNGLWQKAAQGGDLRQDVLADFWPHVER